MASRGLRGYDEETKTSCWPRRFRANIFGFVAEQTLIFNESRQFSQFIG